MKYVLLVILALALGITGGVASDRVISAMTQADLEMQKQIELNKPERFIGVCRALVTDVRDPENGGRVKVKFPWLPDIDEREVWGRTATLMAGDNRGTYFIPDVDDEVLVAFEAGDPRKPYIIGALWSGADTLPEQMDREGRNYRKTLRSRSGIQITMDDTDEQESLTLKTPDGQRIILKDVGASIELCDDNGNNVKMEANAITVNASGKVIINASSIEVTAGALTVNAGISKFLGVVQADTVIANSVVSSTYTPGAGK